MRSCADHLLLLLTLLFLFAAVSPAEETLWIPETRTIELPSFPVDAQIADNGYVYVLMPGVPHLIVFDENGTPEEYDLSEIQLPGGMELDDGWGYYVTGSITGTVHRYDENGELLESRTLGGRVGDVSSSGLSLLYVSPDDGTIRSLSQPDAVLGVIQGTGEGRLSTRNGLTVYSEPGESILMEEFSSFRPLPGDGFWTVSRQGPLYLLNSAIHDRSGQIICELEEISSYSRLSSSGGRFLLWSPDRRRLLVLE